MIDDLLAVTFDDPITLRYQGRNSPHPNLPIDRGHMPTSLQLRRSPKFTSDSARANPNSPLSDL